MLNAIKKSLAFIEPGARGRWIFLVVLAVVVSVLEAMAALLIYVLLTMVTQPQDALELPVVRQVHSAFPELASNQLFLIVSAVMAVFFVGRGAAYLLQSYLQARVTHNAGARLATRLMAGYMDAPYEFHLGRSSSELIRNVYASASEVVGYVLVPSVGLAADVLMILAIGTVLILTAPVVTFVTGVILAPALYVVLRIVQPRLKRLGEEAQDFTKLMLESLYQGLQSYREVRVLGKSQYFLDRFSSYKYGLARTQFRRSLLMDLPRVSMETAAVLFVLGYLVVSLLNAGDVTRSLPSLGVFAYAVLRVLPSINRISGNVNNLKFGNEAIELLHRDLAITERFRSGQPEAASEPLSFDSAIEFDGVSFRYEGAHADALSSVSLEIRRGDSVGVVGPTGGGKTTLIDLLLGLLVPTSGAVRVDGVDIQTRLPAWHNQLGVVPQDVYLLDDTLRRNIAFGLGEEEIDDEALWAAVEAAQLGPYVKALPGGIDTYVGERGVRISGGERQRVAIARALYRSPDVLILDEGTASLDTVTERKVIETLERLRGTRTIVTVAHRLSTVRRCDVIFLIEGGRIVDRGSYDALLASSAAFRKMASDRAAAT